MVLYQVNISSKHKNIKLRWLVSDINFKLLYNECPITHDKTCIKMMLDPACFV